MYQLESFVDGKLKVFDRATNFKAVYQVASETEASALLADLNRPHFLGKVAALRYRIETGGIVTEAGLVANTDRQSQASLNNLYQSLVQGFITSARWKTTEGFTEVTEADVGALARDVAQHVAKCFEAEEVVVNQLKAITSNEELLQFDMVGVFNTAGGFSHYDPTGDFL